MILVFIFIANYFFFSIFFVPMFCHINIILVTGFSVDFSAHISYHFLRKGGTFIVAYSASQNTLQLLKKIEDF